MTFQISKELNDAIETLLKRLPIETAGAIWDAWRMEAHRKDIATEIPVAREGDLIPKACDPSPQS